MAPQRFENRLAMSRSPFQRLDNMGVMVDAYAHVRVLDGVGRLRSLPLDQVGQIQSARVRRALRHVEKEITVARYRGTMAAFQSLEGAGEPIQADKVTFVQSHERHEAARLRAP